MRLLRQLSLYMALGLCANLSATAVYAIDTNTLGELREGDMRKLVIHSSPQATPDATFELADGAGTGTLGDYEGKIVLLNFWATWCAPCRKEMPMISELQDELGGDDFAVVTLATGRNSPAGIRKFFDETEITNLPRHQDPKGAVAKPMSVFGLPTTVLLDRDGNEIARLRGDAEWNSDSAKAILSALIADQS